MKTQKNTSNLKILFTFFFILQHRHRHHHHHNHDMVSLLQHYHFRMSAKIGFAICMLPEEGRQVFRKKARILFFFDVSLLYLLFIILFILYLLHHRLKPVFYPKTRFCENLSFLSYAFMVNIYKRLGEIGGV